MNNYEQWRALSGLSLKEVGAVLGVAWQTVQKWETEGERGTKPAAKHWKKLVKLYNIPIELIMETELARNQPDGGPAMVMTGSSGSSQAGRDIIGSPQPDEPNRPTMLYLSPEETQLIEMIRDYGGRKMVEKFTAELEKRRQEVNGE